MTPKMPTAASASAMLRKGAEHGEQDAGRASRCGEQLIERRGGRDWHRGVDCADLVPYGAQQRSGETAVRMTSTTPPIGFCA